MEYENEMKWAIFVDMGFVLFVWLLLGQCSVVCIIDDRARCVMVLRTQRQPGIDNNQHSNEHNNSSKFKVCSARTVWNWLLSISIGLLDGFSLEFHDVRRQFGNIAVLGWEFACRMIIFSCEIWFCLLLEDIADIQRFIGGLNNWNRSNCKSIKFCLSPSQPTTIDVCFMSTGCLISLEKHRI